MEKEAQPAKQQSHAHIIESYADDMAGVISNDKEGLVQKIIHEQEEREIEQESRSPGSAQNKFFLLVSLLFLLLAFGLISYYYFSEERTSTVNTETAFKSLILNDNTVFLDITGLKKEEIAGKVLEQKKVTKIGRGELEGIYFTENKKVIGFSRFNTLIKSTLSQSKTPAINDNFLLGIISFEVEEPVIESAVPALEENKSESSLESIPVAEELKVTEPAVDPLRYKPVKPTRPELFILLSVKSFADVFSVMRIWEEKMFFDLHEIFGIEVNKNTNYMLTGDWTDGIVQNKNARILYDDQGDIVLMYVYTDNNHVVIATEEETIRKIIESLVASKVRK